MTRSPSFWRRKDIYFLKNFRVLAASLDDPRLWFLCLVIVISIACSGCAGAVLRFAGMARLGIPARAGAAMAGGEAGLARLALTRPAAFRAGIVAMDVPAASRIAMGQRIAAMPQEASMMRAIGLSAESQAGQVFLRQLTAVDSQMSTMLLSDGTFAGMKTGQRVYTSIKSGFQTRAGWVRKVNKNRVIFNDGAHDLIQSELRGDEEVIHYSLNLVTRNLSGARSGIPTACHSTRGIRLHVDIGPRGTHKGFLIRNGSSILSMGTTQER